MLIRFALLALLAGSCMAQDAARMDQIVQSYVNDHTFMGSVLVARGAEVLFSKGYGFADLEWNVPNTPGTKFRLGSVTKQFTAASILLLEERGKLSVTDPVKKYLPDAPAAWDKITIFHVLTHTSGIPNFTGFPDYPKLAPFPTTAEQVVARFRDKPLDFEPGSKYSYSNSGFVLLTYLIENITGSSYQKFLQQNLFTPLGMKDSGYDSNAAIIPHRASGYVFSNNHFENAGYVDMTVPQGAGGLYSTTEDLLKWEQGLFGGKVLRSASLEKMTTPFKSNYAFGLEVQSVGGHKVIEHGGAIQGFNTDLAYYPDDKVTVVALGNVNGPAPEQIAAKLAALVHGETVKLPSERKEITLDPKTLSRYVGAYRMPPGPGGEPGPNMVITLENNQLSGRLGTQQALPIYLESPTMFFLKVVDAEIEFTQDDAQGRPTKLILHQNGRDMPATRLGDAEAARITDEAATRAATIAKRFKDQTPAPGSEAALLKMIEGIQRGKPDYDMMSPGLAAAVRQQLPQTQSMFANLGALQSVTFKSVGPAGPDIYQVKFENGSLEYRIWLTPDGKIDASNFHPL
jgi:CubicO group peptidase (beta-lactamase class C family)